tara:strand:+ start:257 stop:427 length:171 start_codon:yes stop_codon:yes gene_type:complete
MVTIAGGSNCEFSVRSYKNKVSISQKGHEKLDVVVIYVDDIPELIKELERISKGEE